MNAAASARKGIWRLLSRASLPAALGICGLAVAILVHDVRALSLGQVANALSGMAPARILVSLILTGVSFLALGAYDVFANRVAAMTKLPAWLAWFGGATANAVSNTLGFHAVTGTFVRFRLYGTAGLGFREIAKMVALSWATLGLGFITAFALALMVHDAVGFAGIAGAGMLAMLGLLLQRLGGKSVSVAGYSFSLPAPGLAALQMAIGAVEMAAAIGALYVLAPGSVAASFPAFSVAYIGAVLLGIVSHAPGGIGVFEAAMLSFAGNQDRPGMLAALLLYRLLYNFLPFLCAVLALAIFEMAGRRQFDRG